MKHLRIFFILSLIIGMTMPLQARKKATAVVPHKVVLGVWHTADTADTTVQQLAGWMQPLCDAGITDFYIEGTPEQVELYVQASLQHPGTCVHAWMPTMDACHDSATFSHPEWFEVNRMGNNSLDYNPYVPHYKWLSPAVPEARQWVKDKAARYAKIPGVASVHLDFIRFNDAFLGRYTQEHRFHIQQDHYDAMYDFGYHPMAIAAFKQQFGYSPLELTAPWMSPEWLQFRLNELSSLVNEVADTVHGMGQEVSAAVFPFPTRARMMVYQDWPTWRVDVVCPMNYQSFYKEGIGWIKFSVENGLRETFHHNRYISGIFVHDIGPDDIYRAAQLSVEAGADGVNFFSARALLEDTAKLQSVARFHHDYPSRK